MRILKEILLLKDRGSHANSNIISAGRQASPKAGLQEVSKSVATAPKNSLILVSG